MVVALQGNPRDDSAVDYEAVALAGRIGAGLVAVRVVPPTDTRVPRDLGPLSYLRPHRLLLADDSRLAYAVRAGRDAGLEVETELLASADPAGAIAEAAQRHHAAVVLVEPPGDGPMARLRGWRLARRVRRLAHAPVFTVGGFENGGSV